MNPMKRWSLHEAAMASVALASIALLTACTGSNITGPGNSSSACFLCEPGGPARKSLEGTWTGTVRGVEVILTLEEGQAPPLPASAYTSGPCCKPEPRPITGSGTARGPAGTAILSIVHGEHGEASKLVSEYLSLRLTTETGQQDAFYYAKVGNCCPLQISGTFVGAGLVERLGGAAGQDVLTLKQE